MSTTLQRTGDANTDKSLAGIVNGVQALERLPLNDGVLMAGVILATTDTPIRHGLGRSVRGYVVTKASAAAQVYDGTPSTAPQLYANLRASAPVTVSLWVF